MNGRPDIPWLALVLIAEGEAELKLNAPVAECVSADRPLAGVADAERGNYLSIAKSRIDQIFPTQLDVPLLAHAREVDISDTELMMGDDDGFLAVVICNRLPLPAKDDDGKDRPVKYLACLVNLEGQFNRLRERAPDPVRTTFFPNLVTTAYLSAADVDRVRMKLVDNAFAGSVVSGVAGPADHPIGEADLGVLGDEPAPRYRIGSVQAGLAGANTVSAAVAGTSTAASWGVVRGVGSSDVYAQMATGFEFASTVLTGAFFDPVFRFPVLLHWSFTSVGDTTFRELMENLDSGMVGTLPEPAAGAGAADESPLAGRPPLELVETGHVGLPQRTRVGDEVRCWYRGPLVAHPAPDPDDRLDLAHASDQLRIIVPDGREDLSFASAFEIGRLLALARPSVTAGLLRWRQIGYQTSRRRSFWEELDITHFGGLLAELDPDLSFTAVDTLLQQTLVDAIVTAPEQVIGHPSVLVKPGRTIPDLGDPARVIASGFALAAGSLKGPLRQVVDGLANVAVATGSAKSTIVERHVAEQLDATLGRLVVDTLGDQVTVVRPTGPGPIRIQASAGRARRRRDAVDRILTELRSDGNNGNDDAAPDRERPNEHDGGGRQ